MGGQKGGQTPQNKHPRYKCSSAPGTRSCPAAQQSLSDSVNQGSKSTCDPQTQSKKRKRGEQDSNDHTPFGNRKTRSAYQTSELSVLLPSPPPSAPQPLHTASSVNKPVEWGPPQTKSKPLQSKSRSSVKGAFERASVSTEDGSCNSVEFWTRNHRWPKHFAEREHKMDAPDSMSILNEGPKTASYSQMVKNGKVPEQYTSAYETWIFTKGLNMDLLRGQESVLQESKTFCELLQMTRPNISRVIYPEEKIPYVVNSCQNRNEALVNRDITPLILPPVSALYHRGDESLENVIDEVSADWFEQCYIAGPKLRPDLALGIGLSAFTAPEVVKLNIYTSVDNWTRFTNRMYFPFLMLEVKCGHFGLDKADRQNMHSSSVALRAVLRIVQEADKFRSETILPKLFGKILIFSVSHDQSDIRIYGHFASLDGGNWSYRRYRIKHFDILSQGDLLAAHNFLLNILEQHMPKHLKLLQDALRDLPESSAQSHSAPTIDLEGNSQLESGDAAQVSVVAKLIEQMQQQMEDMKQQMEEMKRQKEQL